MTRTKHDLRSEATRRRLVTAARTLFGAHGYAEVTTPRLVWSNFAHLFSVSLIPFTTEWIADSRLAAAPVVLCASVFVLVNITYLALCFEVVDRPAHEDITQRVRRLLRMRSFITVGVFAASAVVALKWPVVAMVLICLCLIGYLRPDVPAKRNVAQLGEHDDDN